MNVFRVRTARAKLTHLVAAGGGGVSWRELLFVKATVPDAGNKWHKFMESPIYVNFI
jgi:hypothetical protein